MQQWPPTDKLAVGQGHWQWSPAEGWQEARPQQTQPWQWHPPVPVQPWQSPPGHPPPAAKARPHGPQPPKSQPPDHLLVRRPVAVAKARPPMAKAKCARKGILKAKVTASTSMARPALKPDRMEPEKGASELKPDRMELEKGVLDIPADDPELEPSSDSEGFLELTNPADPEAREFFGLEPDPEAVPESDVKLNNPADPEAREFEEQDEEAVPESDVNLEADEAAEQEQNRCPSPISSASDVDLEAAVWQEQKRCPSLSSERAAIEPPWRSYLRPTALTTESNAAASSSMPGAAQTMNLGAAQNSDQEAAQVTPVSSPDPWSPGIPGLYQWLQASDTQPQQPMQLDVLLNAFRRLVRVASSSESNAIQVLTGHVTNNV